MNEKISLDKLNQMLADPKVREAELRKYFVLDEENSRPFAPVIVVNESTVKVPNTPEAKARSEAAMTSANGWARFRRWIAFQARIAEGYNGPVIVSEGDSWFQYPLLLDDVIDHLLDEFAIRSLDAAGDTLENIARQREYMDAIAETRAAVFLISAGGNDALGGGDLRRHLHKFEDGLLAANYLLGSFDKLLDRAIGIYDGIFREVERVFPQLPVICHGYDYAIPHAGKWLGLPMTDRGIESPELQSAIAVEMVNRFNLALLRLTKTFPNVTYVDVRKSVTKSHWYDELHPDNAGFGAVAKKIREAILTVTKAPKGAPAKSAEPAASPRAAGRDGKPFRYASLPRHRNAVLASSLKLHPPKRTGLSLHIGLNAVNPEHYANWDGKLAACEFDAEDMEALAKSLGYDAKKLLTADATRENVLNEIREAAKKLKAGDIFLLSYSGHGGQLPDLNGDEPANNPTNPERLDDTWCLFDAQLIDDELYMLWTAFGPDVRIVVVSDSCHSGTVLKATPNGPVSVAAGADLPPSETPRAMPRNIAARVYRNNRAFYNDLGRSAEAIDYEIASKELVHPLACTVRLLSGCQDNQSSYDGMANGEFTGRLLQIWAEGQFLGNYKSFYDQIKMQMPDRQTPNHWVIGQSNAAFDAQRPFEI